MSKRRNRKNRVNAFFEKCVDSKPSIKSSKPFAALSGIPSPQQSSIDRAANPVKTNNTEVNNMKINATGTTAARTPVTQTTAAHTTPALISSIIRATNPVKTNNTEVNNMKINATRTTAAQNPATRTTADQAPISQIPDNTAGNDSLEKTIQELINQGAIRGSNNNEVYMWLKNSTLEVDPFIQRNLDPLRVELIARYFRTELANPLKVTYRDGKFIVIDGQHTRAAMAIVFGSDDFPVFCRVLLNKTKEDEARIFAAQFGFREDVPMGFRLRALEVAKDPTVLNFLRVTREKGYLISLGSQLAENGRIGASCTAYKAYMSLGAETYGRMLEILHSTWAGETWSVNKYMLAGMACFMKMYDVKQNTFVKAFREVTYKDIRKEAERFHGMTKDGAFACALAEIFDRNSGSSLKPAM